MIAPDLSLLSTCQTCDFWVPNVAAPADKPMGECWLNPPVPFPIMGQNLAGQPGLAGTVCIRPGTKPGEWCAHHSTDLEASIEDFDETYSGKA